MNRYLSVILISALALLQGCKGEDYGSIYALQEPVEILEGASPVFPAEGGEATIVVSASKKLLASSSKPWLETEVYDGEVLLIAEPNPDIMARYAEVLLVDGDKLSAVYVQQFGASTKFRVQEAWTVSASSSGGVVTASVTEEAGADAGQYFVVAVPEADVTAAGVGDDLSLFLSVDAYAEKAKIGKTFYSGSQSFELGSLSKGVYYIFVIGISSERVCNFSYAVLKYNNGGLVI
ncbi:MAG: BACON domain-containing protein [Bacteroidales bacterium]|nr:BACON domain-containing protein [Bacteroidales bacterium]